MDHPILSVQDLKVYFRGQDHTSRAVDGVDFDVKKGETVCLVGESGCGKTVSALAVMGLIPTPPGEIVSGKILFREKDLLQLEEAAMQRVRGTRSPWCFRNP
ncbi:MAG: ATP-binding cassette domain-containing protein [Deltaproteobacteria bacterium]|nr:ATP-binding cassette domain-containing protein [Deltaproteobacteria bacterium]